MLPIIIVICTIYLLFLSGTQYNIFTVCSKGGALLSLGIYVFLDCDVYMKDTRERFTPNKFLSTLFSHLHIY